MPPIVLATAFGIVFVGELPDKTMFASLALAARGRIVLVWLGVAGAFLVHVAVAVTVGGVLFTLLPHPVVQAVAALMFLVGAVIALRISGDDEDDAPVGGMRQFTGWRTMLTAFLVIFVAEWGDLTQILTANLAARYNDPLTVGVGATLALWAVGGLAMFGGRLLRRLPVPLVRRVTAAVLIILAGLTVFSAVTGIDTVI